MPPSASEALRDRLDARRGELEQETLARIAAIADPARVPDPAYAAGLRAALIAGLDYGLAALTEPGPGPVPVELLAQARLAARNGVGLNAVLRRYSAGHTLVADGLLEEAASLGFGAVELQTVLRALAARYDRIVAAVSEEYEREADASTGVERRRYALLRRLLAGDPLDTSSVDYPFEANHLAFVASGHDISGSVAGLAENLDRRLLLVEADTQLAWAWIGGRPAFEQDELDFFTSYPWPGGCAVGFGEAGAGLAGWRLGHRQALAALPIAQRGRERVVHYAEVALLASALQDDLLLTSLRRRYLGPLDHAGATVAKDTLRAYFDAAGNVSSAAAALGVSRGTLRGRLALIEKHLDRTLEAVRVELELLLRLDEIDYSPYLAIS